MSLVSLEDAGWRKICPKSSSIAEGVASLCRKAGYNLVIGDLDVLVEPKTFPSLYSIRTSIDSQNFDTERVLSVFESIPPLPNGVAVSDIEDPDDFVKQVREGHQLSALRYLKALITLAHPSKLPDLMATQIVPAFLERFSGGRIWVVEVSDKLSNLLAFLRVVSPYEVFDRVELQPLGASFARMMSAAHMQLGESLGADSMQSLLTFMFPSCYGLVCTRPNYQVIFQFPSPIDCLGNFPREILDLARLGSIFHQPAPIEDLRKFLKREDYNKTQLAGRWVCGGSFDRDSVSKLIQWAVVRVNQVYSYIFDFTNHVSPGTGYVSFILQKKRLLTLERIVAETNIIVSERDSYVRKTLYFNLHDKIASLMADANGLDERMKIFNRLLKPSHFKSKLLSKLKSVPEPFHTFVVKTGEDLIVKVFNEVLGDVWAKHRLKKNVVVARKPADSTGPISAGVSFEDTQIDVETFVAQFIHACRNTMHSYFLTHHGFERYLSLNQGTIPDVLPDLASIFLFLLLEDTAGLFSGDWKAPQTA